MPAPTQRVFSDRYNPMSVPRQLRDPLEQGTSFRQSLNRPQAAPKPQAACAGLDSGEACLSVV